MRALAEFIMRGPKQAALFATLTAIAPLTSWLSAAALGLVVLRQGFTKAIQVIIWPLLPALYFAIQGQLDVITTLLCTVALAHFLRTSVSWAVTLGLSVLLGVLVVFSIKLITPDLLATIVEQFNTIWTQSAMYKQLGEDSLNLQKQINDLLPHIVVGLLAFGSMMLCIVSLIVARWWQSMLFVPDGFREEFHALRLPIWLSSSLMAFIILGIEIDTSLAAFVLLASLPLFFAGIALVHGSLAKKQMSKQWLILFYLAQLLFLQVMYPLLVIMAFLDSLLNFRGRLQQKPPV
ncbi:hypothetical protein [Zooshikella harenae]|uniref:DUF2232 domain-containing protein n=1 Tax=Zooshikella harenae TaxID=2827238 RepID=A0ABS5ZC68_9GAMM|nr:hypothetical protein [Zooshikella harenae]MBU2710911.1 hypothetical protein [Zooshikella harenae]